MNSLMLFFDSSAQQEAAKLKAAVEHLGYEVKLSVCGDDDLLQVLTEGKTHVCLLLNDGLLHSLECQLGLLDHYSELQQAGRITPILCSSRRQGPGNVEARVLTSLSRVSDVIRYMNYWQNAYLLARREPRSEQSETALADVRRVSREVGELLRKIREQQPVTVYELLDEADTLQTLLLERVGEPETQTLSEEEAAPSEESVEDKVGVPLPLGSTGDEVPSSKLLQSASDSAEPEEQDPGRVESDPAQENAFSEPAAAEEREAEPIAQPESNDSLGADGLIAATQPQVPKRKQLRKAIHEAFAELRAEDPTEAIAFAGRGLVEDPDNNKLRYALALTLLEHGADDQADEARYHLEQLAGSKYAALGAVVLGKLAFAERNYGSARRHFELAYELSPRVDSDLTYTLGALIQDEFPEERDLALDYLKQATKRDGTQTADAWYRLGQFYAQEGQLKKAARCYKTARSLDRQHPFAAYDLAIVLLQRGKAGRAHRYFKEAIAVNPEVDTEENRAAFKPPTPELEASGFGDFLTLQAQQPSDTNSLLDEVEVSQESSQATPSPLPRQPQSERRLTVLITGASSGIGRATAREFAKHGHRLILTGRRVERLRALSAELNAQGQVDIRLLSFDVTNLKAANQVLGTLPQDWRDIDVLINNAGKAKGLDFIHEGSIEHWEEMIDTNVKGLLYMTRLVSPGMVQRGEGHIINVCSTAGHEVYPKGAVYCATKHAVDALTQGTRLDLHTHGIRVSQVSPAHVEETEFAAVRFDGDQDRAQQVYEGFQPLRSHDVAKAIYFIATQPDHVNVQDVLMLASQQANSTTIARTGR